MMSDLFAPARRKVYVHVAGERETQEAELRVKIGYKRVPEGAEDTASLITWVKSFGAADVLVGAAWSEIPSNPRNQPLPDEFTWHFRRQLAVERSGLATDVVAKLVQEYGSLLREARAVELERNPFREDGKLPVTPSGYLKCPGKDFGLFFSIRGREDTLSALVKGAAMGYRNFTCDNNLRFSSDTSHRNPHFNAVIAYPGAGKSTVGTDFSSLLREFWLSGKGMECLTKRKLNSGSRLLSEEDAAAFGKMIEDSWSYNCCLYHNIDDYQRGKLHPVEVELAAENSYGNILALRLLFAAISKPVSTLTYGDLMTSLGGIVKRIMLRDTLLFIRRALDITHDRLILVSLFLDEINGAQVNGGGTSWVQEILSLYVYSLQAVRGTNVLPLITVSCTKHEAASLQLTASRRTPHVPIPVFPLSLADALEVVTLFFRRLSATLGMGGDFQPNNTLQLCIELAGGMPRYLGFMIRGMVTSDGNDMISPGDLLSAAQHFDYYRLEATISNTVSLCPWDPMKYREGPGFRVLVAAMRFSVLGTTVYRYNKVVDAADVRENNWGRLEQKGLVCLQPLQSVPQVEPEDWPCRCVFPPLLALKLQQLRVDAFGAYFPSATARGPRLRELNDLRFIAFMILLLKLGSEHPPLTFRLPDILPQAWDIHSELLSVQFPCPSYLRLYQTRSRLSGSALLALQRRLGHDFGLLCCGNYAADSVLVVADFLIVIQTRSSDDAKEQAEVKAGRVFWSCFSDLTGIADLKGLQANALTEFGPAPDLRSESQKLIEQLEFSLSEKVPGPSDRVLRSSSGALKLQYQSLADMDEDDLDYTLGHLYPLEKIIYVYSCDQHIDDKERNSILTSKHPLCKRIVMRDTDSLGLFDILSSVRHLMEREMYLHGSRTGFYECDCWCCRPML